jgi:hypothetical protein
VLPTDDFFMAGPGLELRLLEVPLVPVYDFSLFGSGKRTGMVVVVVVWGGSVPAKTLIWIPGNNQIWLLR